ncbi:FAD-dependent oxidoreductase [Mesorhizobium sp. M0910]|uniref:NAD(P)/FAD-dependent oxidoreductase n=1 Tax=Mesorhizobium sp. M0910 TaxID=2957025 RepID=UPI003337425A
MQEMSSTPADVVVIGAGIVGVMTALELQQSGRSVLLIDRDGPASGCSFGNGGGIGPNTCIPFALPGILRQIPKWYLDPDGPVIVNPGWVLRSFPWIWRWLLSSRESDARRSAKAMQYLYEGCLDSYRSVLGSVLSADLLREQGYLYVYESETPGRGEIFAMALRRELGIPFRQIGSAELREMEPALSPVFRRATLLPGNGHTTNPKRLVDALFERFRTAGGRFSRAEVTGFATENGELCGLTTPEGAVPLRQVVLCAGVWSGGLAGKLGVRVPLVAERGYHVTYRDSPIRLNHKIMNGSRGFGATSMETGLQITGTVELADIAMPPNWDRTEALTRMAEKMFVAPLEGERSRWMGGRPSLPDSLPVLDRSPRFGNAFLNFGHSHWGLCGAPRSARLVADMILGRPLPTALGAYAWVRFK